MTVGERERKRERERHTHTHIHTHTHTHTHTQHSFKKPSIKPCETMAWLILDKTTFLKPEAK